MVLECYLLSIIITLLFISNSYQQYCGPTNPNTTQECLNDSDRQNICCLATFYQTNNYTGIQNKACISTAYNSTYVGKRSMVGFNIHNAIYDCNPLSDYNKLNETDLIDNFYGVPYCSIGPSSKSESDCVNATDPNTQNCCFVNGTIKVFAKTMTYSLCLTTGFDFINSTIANNVFSSVTKGQITCRDQTLLNVTRTINIGATQKYIIFSLISMISFLFIIIFI
jgi:hypothetical protein